MGKGNWWNQLLERAREIFGITDNCFAAGFILDDGTMLDFSGGGGQVRLLDHRDISESIDFEAGDPDIEDIVQDKTASSLKYVDFFTKETNSIRFSMYPGKNEPSMVLHLDTFHAPTNEQKETIKRCCLQHHPRYIAWDIHNKENERVESGEYEFPECRYEFDELFRKLREHQHEEE